MRIDPLTIRPVAWKNGGGVTRELVHGGGWRLSLADIDHDGPFSDYPGVERFFAVVAGDGVELTFGLQRHVQRTGQEPLRFDGARGPHCRLLNGPTRDLNLLLSDGTRGTMRRAPAGDVWNEPWPLRGRFDAVAMVLYWQLPEGPLQAEAEGLWIGIAA
jgi:uncharacterized protein